MSRIGKQPISLVKGVSASISGNTVTLKGPKGEMSYSWQEGIDVIQQDDSIQVTRKSDDRHKRSLHGLTRSLINNMMIGVTQGYKRELEVNGVGFKAEIKGKSVFLTVGFSNPVEYQLPNSVEATVDKSNKITLTSIDKQAVGQAAADIRAVRPPEPYKGKGIKYVEEQIKRKVGKTTA